MTPDAIFGALAVLMAVISIVPNVPDKPFLAVAVILLGVALIF